jgi:acyl-CoA reductase-like NAD-dependent aldehyde dehydrogenase
MYDFPIFVAGKTVRGGRSLEIKSPYDGRLIGKTVKAGPAEIESAVTSALQGFNETRRLPMYERAAKLARIAAALQENREEFARIICDEAGKPLKYARIETERAALTFNDAAEECKRLRGEYIPLDYDSGSAGRWGIVRRFPLGIILGISPFNFPLNLVAHKVAPALAAGNSIILKPASQTPLSALRLAEEILKTEWPAGTIQVLPMDSQNAHLLVEDPRIKMLTFTGSPLVGWALKNKAGHKRVTLELGGNAGVIIHHDADAEQAAGRCAAGGFAQAGQSCISVQRIYVHDGIYDKFMDIFLQKIKNLKTGDPADENVDVGPMIHPAEMKRVKEWLQEALDKKAKILTGGRTEGSLFYPTVVTGVDPHLRLSCQEVFAPLVVIYRYTDTGEVLDQVNDSEYGLQAGLFTHDARFIFQAFETLEVGGVIVGDVPTYRIDPMPYGGTKLSGLGREGVRYAMEEMTEMKLLVLNITI